MPHSRPDARLARVRERVAGADAAWLLLPASADFRWLTGGRARATERLVLLAVPRSGDPWCLVPRLEAEALAAECPWLDLEVWDEHEDPLGRLARRIELERKPALLLGDGFRTGPLLTLAGRTSCRPAAPALAPLRASKDADELRHLAAAGRNADQVVGQTAAFVRPGMTEQQVARFILERFDALGDSDAWAIVAGGPNSAMPHHMTSPRPLAEGEVVLLDLGAFTEGYGSDITRTFWLGGAASDEFQRVYAGQRSAPPASLRAGSRPHRWTGGARGDRRRLGGPCFVHRTGHGVGLGDHEPPYLVTGNEAPLAAGMVHSVEPGIYLPGRFGVRLEDLVVVEPDRGRRLNDAPFAPLLEVASLASAPRGGTTGAGA
jgi:D-alanyl-D-alanine dipeptidase